MSRPLLLLVVAKIGNGESGVVYPVPAVCKCTIDSVL